MGILKWGLKEEVAASRRTLTRASARNGIIYHCAMNGNITMFSFLSVILVDDGNSQQVVEKEKTGGGCDGGEGLGGGVTYSVPYALISNRIESLGLGQGLSLGVLNLTVVIPQDLKEKEERIRLGQFLIGLNEIYSAMRGQIMLMHPLPTVKKAYSLLCEEEKQRGLIDIKGSDLVHAMKKSLDNTSPSPLEISDYSTDTHQIISTPSSSETNIQSPISSSMSSPHSISSSIPPLRRSDRVRQPSILLRDFHYGQVSTTSSTATANQTPSTKSGTRYPLSNYISYGSLSSTHKHFVNTI
ncbi:hypothetical protein JRO89_XS10G0032600 [Xanthoceras sorbifolium]|uniref:Uncharacterized protein n=1 Tax=Xanthoceras sorbifolium TaxID=99658 RepID=A0ABQ8HHG0_9ROSI|nr:hypothetical protein JRO89_XS10G0032600 [Xanthoceras sorbifolium]